jgi:hypothetical protein
MASVWSLFWDDAQKNPWVAIQGIALVSTVFIAWYQLWRLRLDQRGWETIKACERYDLDPVLDRALCHLRKGRNEKRFNSAPREFSLEVAAVSNYFEGMVLGSRQGFYDERIVRDHLEDIIRDHADEFLAPVMTDAMGFERDGYSRLLGALKEWKENDDTPRYRLGRFSK